MKIYIENLGCVKNQVDSEIMLGLLKKSGCNITDDPFRADTIIVNTCSFIRQAVDESIDTILEFAELKKKNTGLRIIVTGCLPERFREDIVSSLPEVDIFLGTGAIDKIIEAVFNKPLDSSGSVCFLPDPNSSLLHNNNTPRLNTSSYMKYIKVSNGCRKHCTYCIIPKLRGKQRSRDIGDILEEVNNAILSEIKEVILIAQDTTSYGNDDTDSSQKLDKLLGKLAAGTSNSDVWIRFLYGHPRSIDLSVIKTVAKYKNICSYFDLPIQHASNKILKKMGRGYTKEYLYELFRSIRRIVPDAVLRTTVMVGFPGETDEDFEELLDFIQDIAFDHLGCFVYSDSKELVSHNYSSFVDSKISQQRYDEVMYAQTDISYENNKKHLNKTYKVLVENIDEQGFFESRAYFQAPEVDGITYIKSKDLKIGTFAEVKITEVSEYDLIGDLI